MRVVPVSYREKVRVVVRQLEVQKYMLTYHIEGQFKFKFILYP